MHLNTDLLSFAQSKLQNRSKWDNRRVKYLPLLFLVAAQASPAALEPMVENIDNRKVESIVIKNPNSNVVVVFENGSRATLDKWGPVLEAVSKNATVFAYNRPGYQNSDTTDTPRDGVTIVEQLRKILKYKGLPPPYVLVGHSLGGLYVQLFARSYPNDVQGIVLVDALYPRMVKKPEDFPWSTRIAERIFFSKAVREEIDNIYETGEQVLSLPDINEKPMIKLINAARSATAVSVNFGAVNMDEETINFVRGLYPNAKKIVVDSEHQMQIKSPDIVANAVNEILIPRETLRGTVSVD